MTYVTEMVYFINYNLTKLQQFHTVNNSLRVITCHKKFVSKLYFESVTGRTIKRIIVNQTAETLTQWRF